MSDPRDRSDEARIVGRTAELARIDAWLAAVAGGTTALLIRGEPGIGKTMLWRHGLERWRSAGGAALVARPAPEELPLDLGGLVDLLEPVVADVAMVRREDDPIARGRLVLDALRGVAGRGPVLVAIDDIQWLDAASVRALRYALRRLDAEPVGMVITLRSPARDPVDLAGLLAPGRVEVVDLGSLDLPTMRKVVGKVAETMSPRAMRRIHEVSGGNPMFALELARGVSAGHQATPSRRMPHSLGSAIGRRLDAVPPELVPVLETVAALGRAPVAQVRSAVPGDVDALIDAAERQGLLVVESDLTVRFSHPAIGHTVHDRMRPLARRALHERLARETADADLRARHLALSVEAADRTVADLLAAAAARAGERGAHDVAADFAEGSLRLTPPDDLGVTHRRTLDLIRHLAATGEMGRALELANRTVATLPRGARRAEALVERAQLEDDDLETGESLLTQALDEAAEDEALRGRVLDQLGWLRGVFRGDLAAGIRYGRQALAIADASGDPAFRMSAAAGLSNMETLAGMPRPDLMARAVAIEAAIGRPPLWAGPRVLQAEQHLWAGDLSAARDLLESAVAHAEQRNHERWRPYSLYDLAAVEGAAGNLARADGLLRQAIEAARDCEDTHVESWVFYRLALVATWLGRAEEARTAAHRRITEATRRGERPGIARARSVLGLLALSEGDTTAAVTELMESVHLLDAMGFGHPGAIPALPDAVEALAAAGDTAAGEALLHHLTDQVTRVGSRWADAALLRASGAVAVARGDATAPELLQRAATAFSALGFRPDAARARLLLGRALRRSGQRIAAADALIESRDEFAAIGARLWAEQAADELERVAPGRGSGELTVTERRVAAQVAAGRTNREIAGALFIGLATVEAHLTRTYRKLGIRSRSELTRLVAEGRFDDGRDADRRSPM